jgi:hypothetical protein
MQVFDTVRPPALPGCEVPSLRRNQCEKEQEGHRGDVTPRVRTALHAEEARASANDARRSFAGLDLRA